MAIVQCPKCGVDVSANTKECPKCGHLANDPTPLESIRAIDQSSGYNLRRSLSWLCVCLGLMAIFLPLINIQAPIIGQFRWSAYNIISGIVRSREGDGPSFSNMVNEQSQQPQTDEANLASVPWSIRQAVALPFALVAIFICILVIAVQLALNALRKHISVTALIGLVLSGYTLISIFLLDGGFRDSMTQAMKPSGSNNSMFAGLGQMMVASFKIEPGAAIYLLSIIMVALFLLQKLDIMDQRTVKFGMGK